MIKLFEDPPVEVEDIQLDQAGSDEAYEIYRDPTPRGLERAYNFGERIADDLNDKVGDDQDRAQTLVMMTRFGLPLIEGSVLYAPISQGVNVHQSEMYRGFIERSMFHRLAEIEEVKS